MFTNPNKVFRSVCDFDSIDEFGDLFQSFNAMADTLELRAPGNPEEGDRPASDEPPSALDVSGIVQGMVVDQTIVQNPSDDSNGQA